MPETNTIQTDDYMELEAAHDRQSANSVYDENFNDDIIKDKAKLKSFRSKIDDTKSNRSAVMPFFAAVEIDMERKSPVGLKSLFTVWLDNGNKYWLNPMDKSNGLGVLEEILFKYQGDVRVLSPFISLLTNLAAAGISPRAFIEYVILPRMRQDYNWRKWQDNHFESLQIIAQLITTAKDHPPFNKEHLGSGKTRLARDIVLVRYIGRPLAQYQAVLLRDEAKLKSYREAWQKISLQDPLSLYFMRNNALHFIYIMSGKIDLVQLVAIVEQLPDIERSFSSAFPDTHISLKTIQAINLYDYDIDYAIQARKNSGFLSLDFAIEIKAYFNIVKALLQKPTGAYLCAYYASLLKRYKNPVIAEIIYNLIRVIDDRGGMHIYKWHTKQLLEKPKAVMQNYLQFVEQNHGCDPEYPRIYLLFRDEEAAREAMDVFALANNFGLNDAALRNKETVSYKDLLNAYIKEHPSTKELIESFQEELLIGRDRQWSRDFTDKIDNLRNDEKNLYGPLLRSVVRGVGSGWSKEKAAGFTPLLEEYGEVHSSLLINARTEFKMPIIPIGSSSSEHDKFARKQINLVNIEKVWNSFSVTEQKNVNNTLVYINNWNIELNEPLENAFNKKITFENELQETADEDTRIKVQKEIAKQDKTISTLQNKKQHLTQILDKFDELSDLQKFITSLIMAGSVKQDDSFCDFASALLLQRYKHLESITSRMNFLIDDISVDVLSYQQFLYLINLLETLFITLREDQEINILLEQDTILQEILSEYIITKKKQITIDALDAAAKKITGFASLQAERAKWQGILAGMEEKNEKYFHNMEIYTSKTFIDSHYGDMGGICLAGQPAQILRPGFYVQRLVDLTDRQIIGMSILYLSTSGFSITHGTGLLKADNYWHAFAFNPLSSVLRHCTAEQALFLYLQFRLNIEKVAWMTKLPVVLSGIETSSGLISNNGHFSDLIKTYETAKPAARKVNNAKGFSVYYSQEIFAKALVIIDPRGYDEPLQVPTFYAHSMRF
ncbi:MAG: hypothetical protein FWB86_10440 [Treponema sp.]|nr:hypothetical protein [Treponema sp.]MCL2252387.1 hypothetical protein [Treponema sp.]